MITKCPICNSKVTENGRCSDIECFVQHEFTASSNFADFYLENYIVEYRYNADGSFNSGMVYVSGELKSLHAFKEPLDFEADPTKLFKRIENLTTFK